ncbi:MalY/PatB family protein [Paenibacillus agri]|uniref:cysteine-S-conjugate beta-lyase n=1 Tax=Paenibacillus agri TaxID=2744309 RepID=A0A850EEV4_9BACL|nr:MalY/PatB family protein [Paenibacillus agri]NUU59803.1 pyridoxal phosphate-dependent aminotransferase [Paenibacillus agri]
MKYDFDRVINRRNTGSVKWDECGKLFGNENILPLWVADMDFESPPAVKEALLRRAELGLYGYSISDDSYQGSIISWFERRHDWELKREWIVNSPGVVVSLGLCVELFSAPGDGVIIQTPVYRPFYDVIEMNGRTLVKNPLLQQGGRYEMDYEGLERLMQDGAKLMILCSPHNPVGRIWERDELLRLGELCLQYGVTVISDGIHCDMEFEGHKYVSFAGLSPELADITVTALSVTKTFNSPGLQTSFIVASNPVLRRKFKRRLDALGLHNIGYFAAEVVKAAYNESEDWLEELIQYIAGNVKYATDYLERYLPQIGITRPDGTYLLWIDCRALGLDVPGLKKLMYKEAQIAFQEGSIFGTEGEGYLRINLACPRSTLQEALERFVRAVGTINAQ